MKDRLFVLFSLTALTASLLSGCVFAVGVPSSELRAKPTLGRQLSDLKQARDAGAITEEEYQTSKKRLMDSQ